MKELTIQDYPFYHLKMPSNRQSLIKELIKIRRYWTSLTHKHMGMYLSELNEKTVDRLKDDFKQYTSTKMAEIWLDNKHYRRSGKKSRRS